MKNKVLIIDADLENCKQIKYSLLNTDTDVFYIYSLSEGLCKIQSTLYRLSILDILLSQDVDIEMLRRIKMLNDCSLLVLSEQASSTERVMALKLGADDTLTKPCDLEECPTLNGRGYAADGRANPVMIPIYGVIINQQLL